MSEEGRTIEPKRNGEMFLILRPTLAGKWLPLSLAPLLTRNSIADLDENLLKVSKVMPGRLEHMHKAVDEQVLHPADQT